MPDQNKLEALAAVGYSVRLTCGSCLHGRFAPALVWGKCVAVVYRHGKHSDERQAGAHVAGHCERYAPRPSAFGTLERAGYSRFVERRLPTCGTANQEGS